jgi:hypothetical protein
MAGAGGACIRKRFLSSYMGCHVMPVNVLYDGFGPIVRPVRFAEIWLMLLLMLISCEKKTLFFY